jgi:hypothetical protein
MKHVNARQFVATGLGILKFKDLHFNVALLNTECPSKANVILEGEYNGTKKYIYKSTQTRVLNRFCEVLESFECFPDSIRMRSVATGQRVLQTLKSTVGDVNDFFSVVIITAPPLSNTAVMFTVTVS